MKKITRKSFIIATGMVITALLLLNIIVWNSVNQFLLKDFSVALSGKMSLARANLDLSQMGKFSGEKLKEFADEIKNLTGLRTTLIDKKGEILADSEIPITLLAGIENHFDRDEVQESLKKGSGIAIRKSATINKDLIYYCENIEQDGRVIGFLRFAMFSPQFNAKRNFLIGIIIKTNLIILLVYIFGLQIHNLWLNRNLKKIYQQLVDIREDGKAYQLDKQKYQEFDQITAEFNRICSILLAKQDGYKQAGKQILDIFNSMSEGVAAFDDEGLILFKNDTFCQILGIDEEIIDQKIYYEWLHFPPLIQDLEKFLKEKKQVRNRTKYFGEKYIEYEITPLKYSVGGDSGFLLVIRDITKIQQLEKIRTDFVTNVSHEFKTPLTSIRGYAETLSGDVCNDDKMREKFLHKILKQTMRLENLVSDLLKLSRIERNEIEEVHLFDPVPVIEDIAEEFEVAAKNKNLSLTADIRVKAGTCKIEANENILHNIFANLLSNAIQYNSEKGMIRMDIQLEEKWLNIQISDTGIGIPIKEQDRIFERFYRIEKSKEYFPEGSGLGLAILKNTVELIGGNYSMESKENEGSVFRVNIPIA